MASTSPVVPVLRPLLPCAERLLPYLARIDAARCYTNWGPLASELELRLAERLGLARGSVVSASSGTTALVGAILASAGRATPERPVALVPAFTFVATAIAVEQCGYRVHLVDVSPDDWMLHVESVTRHTLLDRTGLVVTVSAYGRPVAQEPWRRFRQSTGIPVVIDAAAGFEAVGEAPAERLGELPVTLSFHATKAFASGEGGCVITSDTPLAEAVTRSLNFGFFGDRESRSASTNGKMSEYHAAVGLAELDAWPAKAQAFRAVAGEYRAQCAAAGLEDRLVTAPEVAGCYVLFECRDDEARRVQQCLADRRVEFRLWYGRGLAAQPNFRDVSRDVLTVTGRIAPLLLGLPIATDLPPADIARVVDALVDGTRGRS